MSNDASLFISSRTNKVALSHKRVKQILWYVAECYTILQKDKVMYSKKWCGDNTRFHFEDYLKMEFVDEYLIKHKRIVQERLSVLEQINFSYETEKRHFDLEGIERVDKIDIFISKLGLQEAWNEPDENVYLAIECKRINKLPDCKDYIDDIKKFCKRKYKQTRLPFEGMMAFIEKQELSHQIVSNEINLKLQNNKTIKTTQYLSKETINNSFEGSYFSSHVKEYNQNETLSIYHLLFDYSKNITD